MKHLLIFILALFLGGCLYFNDRGVSGRLYNDCHELHDAQGNYIESCDENLLDYKEAKEGLIEIKNSISESVGEIVNAPAVGAKECHEPRPCAQ